MNRVMRPRPTAFTLIECIVYLAGLTVVLGIAFASYYECRDFSVSLHRNADDVIRAINIGELWRQDIRSATGNIRVEAGPDGQVLYIPHRQNEIAYRSADGAVQRRASSAALWATVLPGVKSSRMTLDPREHVTAWRWELELARSRPGAHVRPVFTFEAVPAVLQAP